MKKRALFLFILLAFAASRALPGTESKIDSLKKELAKTTDEEMRFRLYESLFRNILELDREVGEYYLNQCVSIAEKTKNARLKERAENLSVNLLFISGKYDEALLKGYKLVPVLEESGQKPLLRELYYSLAQCEMFKGNYPKVLQMLPRLDSLAKETGNNRQLCEDDILAGACYTRMNKNPQAIASFQRALTKAEKEKDNYEKCKAALNMGAVYSYGNNWDFASKYLVMASSLAFAVKDTALIFQSQMGLGNMYYYNKDYQRALDTYEHIRSYCQGPERKSDYAGLLGNIGNVYADMGQEEKGFELQKQALVLFEELGDTQGQTICYNTMGLYYFHKGDFWTAIGLYKKSLEMADQMNSWEDLAEGHLNLSQAYEKQKNYREAYNSYKLYKQFSDLIYNETNTRQLTELELNYRFDNKQKEDELKQLIEQEKFKRSKYLGLSGGSVLLLIIIAVARNNRQRKKANELLQRSNSEIEYKNKNITDSINYAKRIQNSILPPDSLVKALLPDSFILYKPKDIVSGDFYWVEQKKEEVIFAAVDCTGHGVPGAMMSVLGFNLLTQAVKEDGITKPSEILNHLDDGVSTMLRQSTESENVKDGMDLALCSLNYSNGQLQFAGAYNGLWILKPGAKECIEVRPDKMPIGSNVNGIADQYTNHSLVLEKGDTLYIFTDGYADQFGGPKGKKFKYKQLEQVLVDNHRLPMDQQKKVLDETFEAWRGGLEQVDDVLVIGVRYS